MSNIHSFFINKYTQETFTRPSPTDINKHYDGAAMISETDTEGTITYANRKFLDFVGYSKSELVGLPHSIIRHPDMPKGLFYGMWKIIKSKKVWRGYIKSLCRDGSYFWALVYIQPKLDSEGNLVGYVASRRDAYPRAVEEIEQKYKELQGPEHMHDEFFLSAELFHGDELATFQGRTDEKHS
jgi:PAS domain S-box-containing protein